jgi:hypothetical protein
MDAEVVIKKRRSGKRGIDKALNALMKKVDDLAPEVAVKVLATAIAWEKVKAKIAETEGDFDPDNL